jgi:hypothetical protein
MSIKSKAWMSGALATFAAVATVASIEARAGYVCDAPPSLADKRACELAKRDSPDELLHFIQRTRSVYGLYIYDYVPDKDVGRRELTRQGDKAPAHESANRARETGAAASR